ncbi:MAG: TonB family protein [Proteobacteria bacterium]|nr:TonB family protein [Pseudomonadota bacterium]
MNPIGSAPSRWSWPIAASIGLHALLLCFTASGPMPSVSKVPAIGSVCRVRLVVLPGERSPDRIPAGSAGDFLQSPTAPVIPVADGPDDPPRVRPRPSTPPVKLRPVIKKKMPGRLRRTAKQSIGPPPGISSDAASTARATPGHDSGPATGQGIEAGPGPGSPAGCGPGDRLSHTITPPGPIKRVEPVFPPLARRRGIEGRVRVRFRVDEQGLVRSPRILRSDPPGLFDQAVMDALPEWRFQPARRNGQVVQAWVETTILFRLADRQTRP